jgi:YbbR domain-containing protein
MIQRSRRASGSSWAADVRALFAPFTQNWALKLSALGLAFLLWTVVKADNQVEIPDVPVRVVNRDPEWMHVATEPPSAVVVFSGPVRELLRLALEKPNVIVPIDDVTDSVSVHILRSNFLSLFDGLSSTRVEEFRPPTVRLRFDRITTVEVPLAIRLTGSPVEGYEIAGPPRVEPRVVRVSGATSRLASLDSLRLPAIDLGARSATDTQIVAIDTTGLGVIVSPQQAQVIVPIRRAIADTFPVLAPDSAVPATGRTGG